MCDYHGYEFGASYPDSVCIDGYLWDADSYDDECYTNGGAWPCPRCNTETFLADLREESGENHCGVSMGEPWCAAVLWEQGLKRAMQENAYVTGPWLERIQPFTIWDWPDRGKVYTGAADWQETVSRQWPWPVTLTPNRPGPTGEQQ